MKRKILKAAGVFCLSIILCTGMAGCSGKGNDQPNIPDVQTAKESGNNQGIETSGQKKIVQKESLKILVIIIQIQKAAMKCQMMAGRKAYSMMEPI